MRERFRAWEDSGLPPDTAGTVLTVGTFDGIHRGHLDILRTVAGRADASGMRSLLVTFDPHPLEIVNPPAAPPLLTVGIEKSEVVAESGVSFMAVVPFDRHLAAYRAEEFVDEILRKRFHMKELVIGYDHGFGRGREGNVETLQALGRTRGFLVHVVPAVSTSGGSARPASSTLIRRAVAGGDLETATRELGRRYSVVGKVGAGDRRGRLLGFPTINLGTPHPRKLLPPEGVYAVFVQTPRGAFGGMMNLGGRPTFGDSTVTLEAHLLDADVELYGATVKVEFVARLRDVRRFPSPDALRAQLDTDEMQARRALTGVAAGH
ncbi:MAG TPA: bifunctional riboflavin kinase/FAD synthetase [Gemmatimonadaceae bacterium]|nr:bifunctional riboflavin kinase/FAD synthetase [Gemmatimonadaceae bacterium]